MWPVDGSFQQPLITNSSRLNGIGVVGEISHKFLVYCLHICNI